MSPRRVCLALCLAFVLVGPALAAPPDAQADGADEHDRRGKVLYGKGDLEAALAEFRAAFEANPRPAFLFNAAKTLERLGRTREAFDAYDQYLARAEGAAEREAAAGVLAGLCPDVGRAVLRVVTEPAGAHLAVDGRTFPVPSNASLCLAPGRHEVTAAKDGHQVARQSIEARAGASTEVRLTLARVPGNGTVRVTSEVLPATVLLDGAPVGVAPLDVAVPAGGPHELTVDAGDAWQPWRRTVEVREGHTSSVRALPQPRTLAAPAPVTVPPVPVAGLAEPPFNWGWVTLGTSAALAVTGAVLYGLAYDRIKTADGLDPLALTYDDRFDELTAQGQGLQIGAFVSWGLAAAAGIATPFVWTSPSDGRAASPSRPHGLVVTFGGTF